MSALFLSYQKYNDVQLANTVIELLQRNHIPYVYEDSTKYFDVSFAKNDALAEYEIKLKPEDFEKTNLLLEAYYKPMLEALPADYYLYSFTDEELKEIVIKADEWGPIDVQLARQLLKKKGLEVDPQEVAVFKKERITQLAKPDKAAGYMIAAGYFFAIIGGIGGFVIGRILTKFKKVLPDGTTVYAYEEKDRQHGKIMMWISGVFFILWTLRRLSFWFNIDIY